MQCPCWDGSYLIKEPFEEEYVSRHVPDMPNVTVTKNRDANHPHWLTHHDSSYRTWYEQVVVASPHYFDRLTAVQAKAHYRAGLGLPPSRWGTGSFSAKAQAVMAAAGVPECDAWPENSFPVVQGNRIDEWWVDYSSQNMRWVADPTSRYGNGSVLIWSGQQWDVDQTSVPPPLGWRT